MVSSQDALGRTRIKFVHTKFSKRSKQENLVMDNFICVHPSASHELMMHSTMEVAALCGSSEGIGGRFFWFVTPREAMAFLAHI